MPKPPQLIRISLDEDSFFALCRGEIVVTKNPHEDTVMVEFSLQDIGYPLMQKAIDQTPVSPSTRQPYIHKSLTGFLLIPPIFVKPFTFGLILIGAFLIELLRVVLQNQ